MREVECIITRTRHVCNVMCLVPFLRFAFIIMRRIQSCLSARNTSPKSTQPHERNKCLFTITLEPNMGLPSEQHTLESSKSISRVITSLCVWLLFVGWVCLFISINIYYCSLEMRCLSTTNILCLHAPQRHSQVSEQVSGVCVLYDGNTKNWYFPLRAAAHSPRVVVMVC